MKMFRRILFIFLCVVLIAILAGFLLPAKVHVERRLLLSASQKSIFEQVNTLKNWVKWFPWMKSDATMQLIFSGPESGTGAKFSWQSNDSNVGNGSAFIISSVSPDSLQVVFDFNERGKSAGVFHFVKENQNTNVIWSLESNLGMNPVSRWFGLFSDRMIGPDLEKGLFNLDHLMQDNKAVYGYEIIETEAPARIYISVRDTASPGTVLTKLSAMYKKISLLLKSRDLPPTGNPVAVFHNYTDRNFDIEAALPVSKIMAVPMGMNCSEKYAQRTLSLKFYGPYKSIPKAYEALQTYINDNDLEVTGPRWEEYITNPNTEADSSKRQTDIYVPLK